jgi:F-type H+-transporting ATPase subunit delta
MAGKGNARRYAQAVFEIAQENKDLEKWQTDLHKLAAAVSAGSLLDALESPGISLSDKTRFLNERLGDISPMAMNLALLLVSKSRIALIQGIAGEYDVMLDEYRGVQTAEVITAVPLDDRERTGIKTQLGALTGKKTEIKTEVDPGILGGVVARVGGKLLDGSTRSKLAALKKQLESGGH